MCEQGDWPLPGHLQEAVKEPEVVKQVHAQSDSIKQEIVDRCRAMEIPSAAPSATPLDVRDVLEIMELIAESCMDISNHIPLP